MKSQEDTNVTASQMIDCYFENVTMQHTKNKKCTQSDDTHAYVGSRLTKRHPHPHLNNNNKIYADAIVSNKQCPADCALDSQQAR